MITHHRWIKPYRFGDLLKAEKAKYPPRTIPAHRFSDAVVEFYNANLSDVETRVL